MNNNLMRFSKSFAIAIPFFFNDFFGTTLQASHFSLPTELNFSPLALDVACHVEQRMSQAASSGTAVISRHDNCGWARPHNPALGFLFNHGFVFPPYP